MKNTFRIFVEGVADRQFLRQLLSKIFNSEVAGQHFISTDGWQNLVALESSGLYVNEMQRNSDDGGVNLVIFDADNDYEERRSELLKWKAEHNVEFELFLFPNNRDAGDLEDCILSAVNPVNSPIIDSWKDFEEKLRHIVLPWRNGVPLTIPAKKTQVYAYLEVLLGESKSDKKKIKEPYREYTNGDHWNLDAAGLTALQDFLMLHLQ